MTDLEERVERLEEAVGIDDEPEPDEDLPSFGSGAYQMVERVDRIGPLTIWRDEEGDGWIEDSAGETKLFAGYHDQKLIAALEEANRDE